MENRLRITNTAYPDGSVVMYLHGMTPPEIKNLGFLMKQAVFNAMTSESIHTTSESIQVHDFKLEKHLSKAG